MSSYVITVATHEFFDCFALVFDFVLLDEGRDKLGIDFETNYFHEDHLMQLNQFRIELSEQVLPVPQTLAENEHDCLRNYKRQDLVDSVSHQVHMLVSAVLQVVLVM